MAVATDKSENGVSAVTCGGSSRKPPRPPYSNEMTGSHSSDVCSAAQRQRSSGGSSRSVRCGSFKLKIWSECAATTSAIRSLVPDSSLA
eukprot:1726493-Pleurochrysis_carterae.AAC.3